MSKKTRPRRGAPSSRAPATTAGAANPGAAKPAGKAAATRAAATKAGASKTADEIQADELVGRVMSKLWTAIKAGEPLKAELETATAMAIPRIAGQRDPEEIEASLSTALIERAVRRQTADDAALLRLLMSLGTANTKKAASRALAQLTSDGVYPPDWVTGIGKVVPGRAWRRYDIFGDDEAIAATFSYGETEHAIVVQVDLTGVPIATAVGVAANADGLIGAMTKDNDEFDRPEQISLAQARRRMEGPLARCDQESDPALKADTVAFLPVARARARRLPAADSEPASEFTAADRAAAVDEFMKSPLAADAVAADEASTRFWAQALTGYSSRIEGEPPAQVGPRKLAQILLGHVPTSFALSAAQRQHLEPAVTAWARWSVVHRDLGEAATTRLLEQLPETLSRFDQAYDDPDSAMIRGYVSDLAAGDADVSWLLRSMGRRMFALPVPERRDGPAQSGVGSPAQRRILVEAEFGGCTPPPGLTSEEFVNAASGVIEALWQDEPSGTFETASRMFADGISRHDVIHRLAGAPTLTRRESIVRDGFTEPSMTS